MALSTKSVEEISLQKHYADLVRLLAPCIDEVILGLVSNGVIDIDQKNTIRKYGDTPGDKVQYLVDSHIARPLAGGVTDSLMKLLSVMKEFSSCGQLVASIEKDLDIDSGKDLQNGDTEPSTSSHEEEKTLNEIAKQQDELNEKIVHLQEEMHELCKQGMFLVSFEY